MQGILISIFFSIGVAILTISITKQYYNTWWLVIGGVSLAIGVFLIIYNYLQANLIPRSRRREFGLEDGAFMRNRFQERLDKFDEIKALLANLSYNEERDKSYIDRILVIYDSIDKIYLPEPAMKTNEVKLGTHSEARVFSQYIDRCVTELQQQYPAFGRPGMETETPQDDMSERSILRRMEQYVDATIARLKLEILKNSRRATIYLILGCVITVFAGYVLYLFLPSDDNFLIQSIELAQKKKADYLPLYAGLRKFLIVVFIESFSIYFLRLYKDSINRTRIYHNELTNIEQRWLAVMATLPKDDKETRIAVFSEIARTERNFVIQKNEKTIDSDLLKNFPDFLEKISKLFKGVFSKQ